MPHIHFKVLLEGKEELTSQFYFDPAYCENIYTTRAPYNKYGKCPLSFEQDIVLRETPEGPGLPLQPAATPSGDLLATARLGVRRA